MEKNISDKRNCREMNALYGGQKVSINRGAKRKSGPSHPTECSENGIPYFRFQEPCSMPRLVSAAAPCLLPFIVTGPPPVVWCICGYPCRKHRTFNFAILRAREPGGYQRGDCRNTDGGHSMPISRDRQCQRKSGTPVRLPKHQPNIGK